MRISDLLMMCLRNLWRRKMRTLLTVIGVVIGTASIVVMISLGVAIDKSQSDMLESMGDLTLIEVYKDWEQRDSVLDKATVEAIMQLPGVKIATPMVYSYGSFSIVANDRYIYQGSIVGINKMALEALGYKAQTGRLFVENDPDTAMLFGDQAFYQFIDTKRKRNNMVSSWPDQNGIIQPPFVTAGDKYTIRINELDDNGSGNYGGGYYVGGRSVVMMSSSTPSGLMMPDKQIHKAQIVGTLLPEEGNYQFDKSYTVYMDIDAIDRFTQEYNKLNKIRQNAGESEGYNNVYVKADSVDNVAAVEQAIKDMGFQTWSLSSIREELGAQSRTIQLILGGIGAISLLVAAIGITNTMIMSIYERTREIGIMKVIGCLVGNIRAAFLLEAGFIGIIGGVAGLLFSYAVSFVLNHFLGGSGGLFGGGYGEDVAISVIPPWLALGALLFAFLVGIVSGFSPANRAVKISALEAIKHE